MVWSDLSKSSQQDIINKYLSGGSLHDLAGQYDLRYNSLARKMRKLRQYGKLKIKNTTTEKLPEPKQNIYFDREKYSIYIEGLEKRYYERDMIIKTNRPFSFLVYSDAHFGEESEHAIDAFLRATKYLDHDMIVNLGDTLDVSGLSKYGKDRDGIFLKNLGRERKKWAVFSEQLSEVSDADKLILGGNHIIRYYKWLDENQGVFGLEEFELENIMRLDEFGYVPMVENIFVDAGNHKDYPAPKLIMTHGTLSRKHAGSTSRGHSENLGYANLIVGHVHRLGVNVKRTIFGPVVTAEAGCLCSLNPGYMSYPDWTNGFLHVVYDSGNVHITPIMIVNGKCYINGVKI